MLTCAVLILCADAIYDSIPELHERVDTSPIRYRNLTSKSQRLATSLSLQGGDPRYALNVGINSPPMPCQSGCIMASSQHSCPGMK